MGCGDARCRRNQTLCPWFASQVLRSTKMWKSVLDETREIAWLAIVIGALSVASVSFAVVLAAA